MILGEGVYGGANAGVDDKLEQRQRGTDSVGAERESGRSSKEAIHDVERIWGQADEEEKLWTLLNGSDHALDRDRTGEPAGDRIAKECAG